MEFAPSIAKLATGASSLTQSTITNSTANPFGSCMFNNTCNATNASALGEQALRINNDLWFTQGGSPYYSQACSTSTSPTTCAKNRSVIVDYSPTNKKYCTYILPEDSPEVIGLTYTGSVTAPNIWVVESAIGKGQVDGFTPAGTCTANKTVTLTAPTAANALSFAIQHLNGTATSVRAIPMLASVAPAQITSDPNTPDILWVSNGWGNSILKVQLSTGQVTNYPFTSHNANAFFGSFPWGIVDDQNYVYTANYSDSTITRLTKSTGAVDVVDMAVTSDTQGGYGLLLSGSKLYFTAGGDQTAGGAMGYIDIGQWEGASNACAPGVDCAPQPANKVLFSDLARFTTTSNAFGLSGIAQSSSGQIAVVDYPLGILTLNP